MPFDDGAEFNWLDEEVETPDLFSLLPNEEDKSPQLDVIGVDALEPVMPLLKQVEIQDDEEVKRVLVDFLPKAPKLKKVDLMFEENKKTPPPPR